MLGSPRGAGPRGVTAHRRCWSQPRRSVDPGPAEAGRPSPTIVEPPGQTRAGRLTARDAERWQRVHDLLDKGLSLKEITQLARGTVRRFARADEPAQLDRGRRPLRGSSLDAHRAFLVEQWRAGNTNAADLLRQLRARGYRGSDSHLRQDVRPWRTIPPDADAEADTDAARPSRSTGSPGTTRSTPATTRDVTRWICTPDARAVLAIACGPAEGLTVSKARVETALRRRPAAPDRHRVGGHRRGVAHPAAAPGPAGRGGARPPSAGDRFNLACRARPI
jgi:DNA-binding transcriptional MerR regulator